MLLFFTIFLVEHFCSEFLHNVQIFPHSDVVVFGAKFMEGIKPG